MRQDREHGFACGALHPPNGETTQANTDVMGMTRQVPAAATGGLVLELKARDMTKAVTHSRNAFPSPSSWKYVASLRKSTVMVRFSRVGCAAVPMCHPQVIRFSSAEETQWV